MMSGVNGRSALLLALFGCLLLAGSQAALAGTVAPKSANKAELLDEVIINARKEKLSKLTHELEKSQDRFFEAYNQINTVREYQVHCSEVTHTGTWIRDRECKPQFIDTATAQEAREYLDTLSIPGASMGTPAAITIAARMPDFQKHVQALVDKNPQLRKMVIEYNAQIKHYQDVRKLKFKGHWFVWD
jgi:hypothetical protein